MEYHIVRIPAGISRQAITGFDVQLEAGEVMDASGFTIAIYAAGDAATPAPVGREILLGQSSAYKPVKNHERISIPLPAPAAEAWLRDAQGEFLRLRFAVFPGNKDAPPPRIRFKWVGATFDTK